MSGRFIDRLREDAVNAINEMREDEGGTDTHVRQAFHLATECRDCSTRAQVFRKMRQMIRADREEENTRFDPMLIVALVQVAYLIWKWLKESGRLEEASCAYAMEALGYA